MSCDGRTIKKICIYIYTHKGRKNNRTMGEELVKLVIVVGIYSMRIIPIYGYFFPVGSPIEVRHLLLRRTQPHTRTVNLNNVFLPKSAPSFRTRIYVYMRRIINHPRGSAVRVEKTMYVYCCCARTGEIEWSPLFINHIHVPTT